MFSHLHCYKFINLIKLIVFVAIFQIQLCMFLIPWRKFKRSKSQVWLQIFLGQLSVKEFKSSIAWINGLNLCFMVYWIEWRLVVNKIAAYQPVRNYFMEWRLQKQHNCLVTAGSRKLVHLCKQRAVVNPITDSPTFSAYLFSSYEIL